MRKNGGGLGTLINVYFAPATDDSQLAYMVRWDADGITERNLYRNELQPAPSERRRAVVNYATLAGMR